MRITSRVPISISKREPDVPVEMKRHLKSTDTITVTMGASIREMYEQGMDFVDKTMTKRLSMEFD